jgi:exodeoxyribonuclease V alpha subunit
MPDLTAPAPVVLTGRIQRIVHRDEESGFHIFKVQPEKGPSVTVLGASVGLAEGKEVLCAGQMKPSRNPRYPEEQLHADSIQEVFPSTEEGMRRYLASGFIPNIGPVMAESLVKHFGVDLFRVIDQEPRRLLEVPNIGEKRVDGLVDAWRENRELNQLAPFLMRHGIGASLAVRVYKAMGANAEALIRKNPYSLMRVSLIGFQRADDFSRQMGVEPSSEFRIQAGLEEVIRQAEDRGDTAVAHANVLERATELLKVGPDQIEPVLRQELEWGRKIVLRELCGGVKSVSRRVVADAEQEVADRMIELASVELDPVIPGLDESHPDLAHLDDDQKKAAIAALSNPVTIITGRPGCGKTTVTKTVLDIARRARLSILPMAPTGRAAKRITEATGYEATTIHRALESDGAGGFRRGAEMPLEEEFIVIDELSMADTDLGQMTLRAIAKGTRVVMVGDSDQLPSIGAGNVLADLIQSGVVPVLTLKNIHRQAMGSSIIVNAHRILNGLEPVSGGDFTILRCHDKTKQVDALLHQFKALMNEGFAPADIQVLTPMRKRTDLGADSLNLALKQLLNPAADQPGMQRKGVTFSVGDRVMQTANNKELGIFNGEIGYIASVDPAAKKVAVRFPASTVEMDASGLDELVHAYATTVHKSQGSEFPAVIVAVAKAHSMMLNRNLLYTAVTRGKRRLAVVGDDYMLKVAVERSDAATRFTGLRDALLRARAAREAAVASAVVGGVPRPVPQPRPAAVATF